MTNWDERARDLRQERAEAEASERRAAAEAEAKEQAKWQVVYDKLADVARWAIGRYQAASVPPTAIYVDWEEEVQTSHRTSRIIPRKIEIGISYIPRQVKIGEAYELYRYSRGGVGDEDHITSVLMVTSERQIIWHDSSEICVKPARPGIRTLDLVCPVYNFFGAVILIWSKGRPTGKLLDYMRPVANHSVRDELHRFGKPLRYKAQSEELDLDPYLNEIVEFVDRRAHS